MKWQSLAVAIALAGCSDAPAGSTTWHVDFAEGSNRADGRTEATAWKHAPGDEAATGTPASATLKPGDKVLFRAGVPYRGSITVPASGTTEAPIVYSGLGWGKGMGIIDGSDPVRAIRPCTSAGDCGGIQAWQGLHRVEFDRPVSKRIILFGPQGLYYTSQLPKLPDPFVSDDRRNFETVPDEHLAAVMRGELVSPALADAARSGGALELAIWVRPNQVRRRPVLRVEGDRLFFDPEGLTFYEKTVPVSLVGSGAGLADPGTFFVAGPELVIARLRPGETASNLSIGSGRFGIDVNGNRDVRIEGLHLRNLVGSVSSTKEGRAVTSFKSGAAAIEVVGNRIGPAHIEHRASIVEFPKVDGLRFAQNRMEDVALGRGFRAAGKHSTNVVVEGNVFRRIGGTALMLWSVHGGVIRGNFLAELTGVHANGITLYLANKDILVENNCVVAASRPMTFHGNKTPDVPNRFTIRNNIFVSNPTGQAAINSWGASTVGVLIEGNIIAGPKMGLLLNKSDRDVQVVDNVTTNIARQDHARPDWTIKGNREDLVYSDMLTGNFGDDGCSIPASGSPLKVVRSRPL